MRLAIADPPYPPQLGATSTKPRASRWYGEGQLAADDVPADRHDEAFEWDDPARHQRLMEQLLGEFDGFAIATAPDGIAAYGPLPRGIRIMAWVKRSSMPGSHRLKSDWEPVLLYPPVGRRSNRNGVGMVSDVLIADPPSLGFMGAKPPQWTRWVLDAMSWEPSDEVVDVFPGSGIVTAAIAQHPLPI